MSANAITLIRRFEGCVLKAYPDPMSPRAQHIRKYGVDDTSYSAEPWTAGYGFTGKLETTGAAIGPDTRLTQQEADTELAKRVAQLQAQIRALLKTSVTLDQFAALSSLCWNIGIGAFSKSILLAKLNGGNAAGAADEFLKWDRAGGVEVKGLLNRRYAERSVFLSEEPTPIRPLPRGVT